MGNVKRIDGKGKKRQALFGSPDVFKDVKDRAGERAPAVFSLMRPFTPDQRLEWERRHCQGGVGEASFHRPSCCFWAMASSSFQVLQKPSVQK